MKTVVVGIDGLTVRLLERYASSLSTLSALRDRGVETPLESTHPHAAGCAWPSLYTGTGPGHHGVYGAVAYDGYPDEPRAVSRIDVRRPAVWDYLSSEGAASIVVDVPVTHPADPIHGTLVPAASSAGPEPGYPTGVREELGEPFAGRPAASDGVGSLASSIDRRSRALCRLLEDADWELALFRVRELDDALGVVDREADLRPLYEAVDRFVGDLLGAVDGRTNVVVCSTRGAAPRDGYRIDLNELLREAGYLEPTAGDEPATPSFEVADPAADRRGSLRRTLRAGLESTLARLGLGSSTDDRVDWYTSLAYCPDAASGGVRVNLAGREPHGTVPPSRYETVRDELVDALSGLETPDGEPAFEFVCRREHLYEGGFLEGAPDVVVAPAAGNELSARLSGRPFEPVDTVGPTREGAFVAAGPGFTGAFAPYRLSVVDVAPIAVASLGRPVPSLMTGSVSDGVLVDPPARAQYDGLVYGAAATDPHFDDGDVRSRLEDVGLR